MLIGFQGFGGTLTEPYAENLGNGNAYYSQYGGNGTLAVDSASTIKGIYSLVVTEPAFLFNWGQALRVRASSTIIAQFRLIQSVDIFQGAYEIWELQAGGTQVATLQTYSALWSRGDRWSLVWDASGPNVTAAIYRNDELLLSGTGGPLGSGEYLSDVQWQIATRSSDGGSLRSITVWDDPAADLNSATSPHEVSTLTLSGPTTATYGSWQSFINSSSPQGAISDRIYRIDYSSNVPGVKTTEINDPLDISFPRIPGKIAIYGARGFVQGLGDEGISSLAAKITLGGIQGDEAVQNVLTKTQFNAPAILNPQADAAWQPPTYVDLVVSSGDGGFESGETFASNGWQALGPAEGASLFLGPQGALSGTRGVYISDDGGTTPELTVVDLNNSVCIYRDIDVPDGAVAITVSGRAKLEIGNVSSDFALGRTTVEVMPTDSVPLAGRQNISFGGTSIGRRAGDYVVGNNRYNYPESIQIPLGGIYQLSGETSLRIVIGAYFSRLGKRIKLSIDDIYIGAIMSYPDLELHIEARNP